MNGKQKKILQAILDAEDPLEKWGSVWNAIAAYAEAETDGLDAPTLYPEVAEYLQAHSVARQIYQDTQHILQAERQGELEIPKRIPRFDLSFLTSEGKRKPGVSIWQETKDNVSRLIADITLQFKQDRLVFTNLPKVLSAFYSQQNFEFALRSKDAPNSELDERLDLPDPAGNIRIKFFTGPAQAGAGSVVFRIETLETRQPVRRARIILRDEAMHLLESSSTGSDGKVTFKDLNVGKYFIQVEQKGRRSEFGVTLSR